MEENKELGTKKKSKLFIALTITLAAIAVVAIILALVLVPNCDDDDHVHEYVDGMCACGEVDPNHTHRHGGEWTIGDNQHWHECELCEIKYDYAMHSWDDGVVTEQATCSQKGVKTFTCSVCGKTKVEETDFGSHSHTIVKSEGDVHWFECECGDKTLPESHEFDLTTWKTDGTNHWHECVCGAKIDVTAHSYDMTTWEMDGTHHWHECECGAKTGVADHSPTTEYHYDETNHWFECECGQVANPEAHEYDTTTWKTDGTNHWHECVCGAKTDVTAHTYDETVWETDGTHHWHVCECGTITGKEAHEYSTTWSTDDTYHWHECECGETTTKEVHNYTNLEYNDMTHWYKCECGEISGVTLHDYDDTVYCSDGTHHWYECMCGAKTEVTAHVYDTTTWITDGTHHWHECVCGAKSDVTAHSFTIEQSDADHHWLECECGEISAEGDHSYSTTWEYDDEYHWHECSCGRKADYAGHSWDAGVMNIPYTCTTDGEMTYTCIDCEKTRTEVIPAAHTYGTPTFVDDAYHQYVCSISTCGNTKTELHEYKDGVCACGDTASVGLSYSLSADRTYYVLTGVGTCTDSEIVIPGTYNDGINGIKLVTSISSYAFGAETTATSIEIPDTITTIDAYAFKNSKISSITRMDNVTTIGNNAFENTAFTTITLNDNVENVGASLFYNSKLLQSVTLGNGITEIKNNMFNGCSSLTTVNFSDNVSKIGNSAFRGTAIESFAVSNSVQSIGEYAFADCDSLQTLVFGSMLRSLSTPTISTLGSYAFANCDMLASIIIPSSLETIPGSAFRECANLQTVIIQDGVKNIGDYAFYGCIKLENITLGNTVEELGAYSLHSLAMTSIELPASLKVVGNNAIYTSKGLTKVNYLGDANGWAMIDFYNYSSNPIYYARSLYVDDVLLTGVNIDTATMVKPYAFYYCESITTVELGDSVKEIGENAFYYCTNMETLTFGSNVTTIGNAAFYGIGISSLTMPENVVALGSNIFSSCKNLVEVKLSDSMLTIPESLFSGCSSIEEIVIPKNILGIGSNAFYGCSSLLKVTNLSPLNISTGSSGYGYVAYYAKVISTEENTIEITTDENGFITYDNAGVKTLVAYVGSDAIVTIPDDVEVILSDAFSDNSKIVSVTIPASVTSIGRYAFENCTNLLEVYNLSSLTMTIGKDDNGYVARYAKKLNTDATIPTAVSIADGYVYFENNNEKIIVYYYGSLSEIVIPNDVDTIYQKAFYNNDNITSVVISDNVTSIGANAFAYCDNLATVTLGKGLLTMNSPFDDCSGIKTINFNCVAMEDLTSYYSFAGYARGVTLNIGAEVTHIPGNLFYSTIYFDNVIFEEGSQCVSMGENAFHYAEIVNLYYNDSIEKWASISFVGSYSYMPTYKCENFYVNGALLTEITLNTVTSIGQYAFYGLSTVTQITIPASVESIGKNAFARMSNIEEINFNATAMADVTTSDGIFSGSGSSVSGITLNIGANVTRIPQALMYGVRTNLKKVVFAEGSVCASIGASAFESAGISSITIPSTVTEIGSKAFYDCAKLLEVFNLSSLEITVGTTDNGYAGYYALAVYTSLEEGSGVFVPDENGFIVYNNKGVISLAGYVGTATEITIPEEVQVIDASAFENNTTLKSVVILDAVTTINSKAFAGCTALESVTFGNGVHTIASSAFRNCTSLTSFEIPETVTSLGYEFLFGCSAITDIYYNASQHRDLYEDNCVFNGVGLGGEGVTLHIGNKVERIPAYMFNPYPYTYTQLEEPFKLTKVIFEEGSICTTIGNNAFSYNRSLTSVTLPSSITTISNAAFYECRVLTEINYNASNVNDLSNTNHAFSYAGEDGEGITLNIGENVERIPARLFLPYVQTFYNYETSEYSYEFYSEYAPNIATVNFVNGSKCASIGEYAFYYSESITRVNYNGTIDAWVQIDFDNQYSNPSLANGCLYLNGEKLGNVNITTATKIGSYAFANCLDIESVNISSTVESIGNGAFYGCGNIKEITIEDGVKTIGNSAFEGLGRVVEIVLPNTVTTIGERSFANIHNLISVKLSDSINVIPVGAFENCYNLQSIRLSNNVTIVSANAFANCTDLSEIYIGASVNTIDETAFIDCVGIMNIEVNDNNAYYSDLNHDLYNKEGTKLILFALGKIIDTYTIPNNLTSIDAYAFANSLNLKHVIIPDHVTAIGDYAFYNCSNIETISIGNGVKTIGNHAFDGCSSLVEIIIPDSTETAGEYLFANCSSLQNVVFGDALQGIGKSAFTGCEELSTVIIGDACTEIYLYAFADCRNLTSVAFGASIEMIYAKAFSNCVNLKNFDLPNTVTYIGDEAFINCTSLTKLTIPASVSNIGENAFSGLPNVDELNYNAGTVSDFSSGMFTDLGINTSGTTVNIGATVVYIPDNFLYGGGDISYNVTSINVEEGSQCTFIGSRAFYGCSQITSITIPSKVEEIGNQAFALMGNVSTINYNARSAEDLSYSSKCFNGIGILQKEVVLNIGATVERIPDYLFYSGTGNVEIVRITEVNFEEGSKCKAIGEDAFKDCLSINRVNYNDTADTWAGISMWTELSNPTYFAKDLYVKGEVLTDVQVTTSTQVGDYAFYNCQSIENVYVGNQARSIGRKAFYNCHNITEVSIGTGVSTMYAEAFRGCSKIVKMTLPFVGRSTSSSSTKQENVLGHIFGYTTKSDDPDGFYQCQQSGSYSGCYFYLPKMLKTLVITGGNIHNNALYGCSMIESLTLPSNATSIGEYAFCRCESLTTLEIPSSVKTIGKRAFEKCLSLTSITIPEGVTTLGERAFIEMPNLKVLNLPSTITSFGNNLVNSSNNIERVNYAGTLDKWASISFASNTASPLTTGAKLYINDVFIENLELNVSSISNYAFANYSHAKSVVFGENVTTIGTESFKNLNMMRTITIPAGVTKINTKAFENCIRLVQVYDLSTSLTISKGNTSNGYVAYYAEVVYTDTTESYFKKDENGFLITQDGLTLLGYEGTATEIVIPSTVTTIYEYAFYNNDTITSITISEGVTAIQQDAFYGMTALTEINYNATKVTSYSLAFEGAGDREIGITLNIGDNVTTIPSSFMSHADEEESPFVTEITIGKGVTELGYRAFGDLKYLTKINYNASNVKDLSNTNRVFESAGNNTDGIIITIGSSVEYIPDYLFRPSYDSDYEINNISKIIFEENSQCVGFGYFLVSNLTNLDSVYYYNSIDDWVAIEADSHGFISSPTVKFYVNDVLIENAEITTSTIVNSNAFSGYEKLKSIVLGDTVETIGNAAFEDCVNLTTVELGEGLTTIGNDAFSGCNQLNSIALSDSVVSIGESAFRSCSSLETLIIGKGLQTIGNEAFYGCNSLASIEVDEENPYYTVVNGSLYTKDGKTLVLYAGDSTDKDIVISEGTVTIKKYAFYNNTNIESVVIPDSVTTIEGNAFYGCASLKSITIGKGVKTINNYAFQGCTNLTEINFNATAMNDLKNGNRVFLEAGIDGNGITVNIGKNVTKIPAYLLVPYVSNPETNITSINFEENSVCTSIGTYAFAVTGITEINIPDSVTSIGQNVFYKCESITEVVIPNGVTSIGNSAFSSCSSLNQITLGTSVTSIGSSAFSGCTSLNQITLGTSVTSVGASAFKNCKSLESIVIPDSVKQLSDNVFEGCDVLESVTLSSGLEKMGAKVFLNCISFKSIVIPDSVTTMGAYAFQGCTALEEVVIGNGLKIIEEYSFDGCSMLESVTFGTGIEDIQYDSFANCTSLKSVILPDGVKSIGSSAFCNCTSLETLDLGESLESINAGMYSEGAFENCTSLKSLTLPATLTKIGNGVFYKCTGLTEINFNATGMNDFASANKVFSQAGIDGTGITVNIGKNVTKIPAYLFYPATSGTDKNTNITSIVFEENSVCTSIGNYAFAYTAITGINIPDSVTSIGNYAFAYTAITEINIPDNVTSIDYHAFYNCSGLETATLSKNITIIPNSLFYYCTKLTGVVIPNGVTSIGSYAFSHTAITEINIPDSVTTIKAYAFDDCTSLKEIIIPDTVTTMGTNLFDGCESLETITIPFVGTSPTATSASTNTLFGSMFGTSSGGLTLSKYANVKQYYKSGSSKSYYIPLSLKTVTVTGGNILYGTFYNCSMLTTIDIGSITQDTICDYAFYGCSALENLTLPTGVTTIGQRAFFGCSSMTEITIPNSVTTINSYAFYGCEQLKKINYLGTIDEWASISFADVDANPLANGADLYINGELVTSATLGNEITSINTYAFYKFKALTELVILDGITSIGARAFYGCDNLEKVTLGNGLETIGNSAFEECVKLEEIVIPNSVTTIESYAFTYNSALKRVTLGTSVATIGDYAFYECTRLFEVCNLSTLTIANDTSNGYVGYYAKNVYTDSSVESNFATDENGFVTYNDNGRVFLVEYKGNATNIVIPDEVNVIMQNVFANNLTITSLTIPENVISIGYDAFYNCSNLAVINYNAISVSDDSFSYSVFSGVGSNIDGFDLNIGANVKNIPGYFMYDSQHVKSVVFAENSVIESIGEYAFYSTDITSITIPDSIKVICQRAFYDCSLLETVVIGDGIESIETYAFYYCQGLKNITLGASLQSVGSSAFSSCNAIEKVNFTGTADGWAAINFASQNSNPIYYTNELYINNELVTDINLTSTTVIGNYAFYNLTALKTVNISSDVLSVGNYAFYQCDNLETINLPASVTSLGDYAFHGCTALKSITIPENLTSIGYYTFAGCVNVEEINYNAILMSDFDSESETFYRVAQTGCVLNIGPKVTRIPAYLFYCYYQQPNITKIIFDVNSVCESIGSEAFSEIYNINTIVVPKSLTSIESYAFYGIEAVKVIYYMGTAEEWENVIIEVGNSALSTDVTMLYYSETEPNLNSEGTAYDGNYWHYVDGVITQWIYIPNEEE